MILLKEEMIRRGEEVQTREIARHKEAMLEELSQMSLPDHIRTLITEKINTEIGWPEVCFCSPKEGLDIMLGGLD